MNAAALALATWSIVAVDPRTHEVGAAAASCIHSTAFPIAWISELLPDRGAVVAQALGNLEAKEAIADALEKGATPAAAIGAATAPGADTWMGIEISRLRQYGAVTFAHAPASFTGSWASDWAGARAASAVSVQGNILVGPAVVEDALAAYAATGESCLAERLLRALEAGAAAGGDRRCVPELGSLSAFLAVAQPGDDRGAPSLLLEASRPNEPDTGAWDEVRRQLRPEPGSADESPVTLLRAALEARRAGGSLPASCRRSIRGSPVGQATPRRR